MYPDSDIALCLYLVLSFCPSNYHSCWSKSAPWKLKKILKGLLSSNQYETATFCMYCAYVPYKKEKKYMSWYGNTNLILVLETCKLDFPQLWTASKVSRLFLTERNLDGFNLGNGLLKRKKIKRPTNQQIQTTHCAWYSNLILAPVARTLRASDKSWLGLKSLSYRLVFFLPSLMSFVSPWWFLCLKTGCTWLYRSGDSWMYPYQRTPMGNPYISPIYPYIVGVYGILSPRIPI